MKYLTIITIIALNMLTVLAQDKKIMQLFDKQPHRRLQQIEGTRYRLIDDLHRTSQEKDVGEYIPKSLHKAQTAIDSTVFVVKDLDTVIHAGKFVFWQDVDASGFHAPFVGDINKNGRAEVYGSVITFDMIPTFETVGPLAYYELQPSGKFAKKFQFPKPKRETFARGIVDLDNDGINELHVRSVDSIKLPWDTLSLYGFVGKDRFMKQPDDTSLAIQDFFKWPKDTSFTNERENQTWGDFDKDGKKDVVFITNEHEFPYNMIILEYNPATKYLDSVYSFDPKTYTQGFPIGDFDNDGKTDIVMGSIGGKAFVVENTGDNSYQNVWTSNVETNNAYLNFCTNDIDGNGKKEFWIGGDGFFGGVGKTRLTCFESNGDNSYIPVARIDFVGIFSFYAGNVLAIDVNNDGVEEIGICMDSGFYLLQFNGSVGHHSYKIIYVKTSEFANYPDYPGLIYGGTIYDVDSDGKHELLISHELVKPNIGRIHDFVRLYKQNLPLNVKQNHGVNLPSEYELSQNYPNPFNASTTIQYRLPKQSNVTVTIYSILGKEIKTIVNQQQEAGEYRVSWNGTDERGLDVNSGVYFIRLRANNFTETKKLLYLK